VKSPRTLGRQISIKDISSHRRADARLGRKSHWNQRHIVLDGPKIPLKCINNVVAVPALGKGIRRWNDDMLWEQLGPADFKQISESVTSILREVEPKLEWFLAGRNGKKAS
jgi:hypothetical protein